MQILSQQELLISERETRNNNNRAESCVRLHYSNQRLNNVFQWRPFVRQRF